jgi:hypothetical protein
MAREERLIWSVNENISSLGKALETQKFPAAAQTLPDKPSNPYSF